MRNNIVIKRGDYGVNVVQIQKALKSQGFWPLYIKFNKRFGPATDRAVRKYQAERGLVVDGKVGIATLELLDIDTDRGSEFDEKYKDVIINGSHFPDKPISYKVRVKLNKEIIQEYIPLMEQVMHNQPLGFKLLITIMAYKEGFRGYPKRTRSYRTNNPGNIGNTDSGSNKFNGTLESGIELQRDYILNIVNDGHSAYPMNKHKILKPYFSPEIAKHSKLYGMSPYLPGYSFTFTGQLDQFVKIYATGARAGNNYLSMILTYFRMHNIYITSETKIQDIIKMI